MKLNNSLMRIVALLALFGLWGCAPQKSSPADIVAGLPPVAFLAQRVAGDGMRVVSALPVGRSPHDFAPRPGEIRDIAGAKFYFSTGMPFENAVAKAVAGGPVRTVDVTRGIKRIPLEGGCCHGHEEHDHHAHQHDHDHDHGDNDAESLDPHVWLDPANAIRMTETIAAALAAADPAKGAMYRKNADALIAELAAAEEAAKRRLAPYQGKSFLVHHPAFGYFAAAAGLKQHGIELGGREPSPARLAETIKVAREHGVKTIFVQPQFNPNAARALANAIGGNAVELDPLSYDLIGNFKTITDHIEKGFSGNERRHADH